MDRCGGINILLLSNINELPQTFTQLFFILSLFLFFSEILAFTATLLIRGLNKGDALLYNVHVFLFFIYLLFYFTGKL